MIINLRYYGLVAATTKKASEELELKKGTTVEAAIKILVEIGITGRFQIILR